MGLDYARFGMPIYTRQKHITATGRNMVAAARIRELGGMKLGGLLKLFPDLEDSFDPDELPIFLPAQGRRGTTPSGKALRRTCGSGRPAQARGGRRSE